MDESPSTGLSSNRLESPLRAELQRLEPALAGFPVAELLEACAQADQLARAHALLMVDRCLDGWIASLDLTIDAYLPAIDDALSRVRARQRGARQALAQLKTALALAEPARQDGGQARPR